MKKTKLLGVSLLVAAIVLFASCDLEVGEKLLLPEPDYESLKVELGGENSLVVSSIKKNNEELFGTGFTDDDPKLVEVTTDWEKNFHYLVVIEKGESVSYEFTQPTKGTAAWKTWALKFTDKSGNFGNALRADTWVNSVVTNLWSKGGYWSTGSMAANMDFKDDYNFATFGTGLNETDKVRVEVLFDGKNAEIKAYINEKLALTNSTKDWSGQIVR